MNSLISKILAVFSATAFAISVQAGTITLGGTTGGLERQATLTDAQAGFYGNGNPHASTIDGYFGDSWAIAGDVNQDSGLTDGFLQLTLTSGTWGGQPVITGTWTILPGFFSLYGDAVISMHVGNGTLAQNPDHFAWLITDGVTSGTWSYDANITGGGGLSNLQLWGSGEPRQVPDHGSTAILLGLGLISFRLLARRRTA